MGKNYQPGERPSKSPQSAQRRTAEKHTQLLSWRARDKLSSPQPSPRAESLPCHQVTSNSSAQKRCGQPHTFWGWMFPYNAAGPSQPRCQSYLINHK